MLHRRRLLGSVTLTTASEKLNASGKQQGLDKDHSHRRVAVHERELAGDFFAGAGPCFRRQAPQCIIVDDENGATIDRAAGELRRQPGLNDIFADVVEFL